jgi:hypothetical protein
LKQVPVLITWDVDPDRWATADHRERGLSRATDLCEEFGIRSTFFFTAGFAHEYPQHIERIQRLDQEIGCHGLTHTDEEDYDRMPEDMQRNYIKEATEKLQSVIDRPVRSFRSPRVKTSATALRLLADHGYLADSSVCSQRIDVVTSNLINFGWIRAPRRPYHPHHVNPYKRGDVPIWEIPISAFILPFISGSLNVFGLRFMKAYFRLLRLESKRTGKPIVYLAHPPEFVNSARRRSHFTRKDLSLSQIRTHGLLIRRALYRLSGEQWYERTQDLFSYIASFPDTNFMTVHEYVDYLENGPSKTDRGVD